MSDSTLEQQIADAEARVADLQNQMQQADERFRQAAVLWMSDWYRREAERIVVRVNPARTLELGLDGVNDLHDEVERLADILPRTTYAEAVSLTRYGDLDQAIRGMTRNLGRVLAEQGFIQVGRSGQKDGEWSHTTSPSSEGATYNGELPPGSNEMTRAEENYRALDGQLVGARDDLETLKGLKLQADAQQLWDRAKEDNS